MGWGWAKAVASWRRRAEGGVSYMPLSYGYYNRKITAKSASFQNAHSRVVRPR